MKWDLNLSLKYLTPSAVFRCSQSTSPLNTSASPTSLFFSFGPRFSASSTVRSNQSSINSSYLNQNVDPSKRDGIFVVIPLPADMLQPMIRPVFLCFQLGSHQDLPHGHASLTLLKFSNNTHSRGILCTTRFSSLQFNHALRHHIVDVDMFFLRDTVDTRQEHTKLQ